MQLQRSEVERSFLEFVENGNGVVVGAPGVGKTHLLRDYCSRLLDNGALCLFLPLDKLAANSETELQSELGIPTDLPTYLHSEAQHFLSSSQNPVVVIDAFDAARSEFAQQFVLRLIRRLQTVLESRWRIVVSVRAYDAKKSVPLQGLFPDTQTNSESVFRDSSIKCRHFLIPSLTTSEVEEAIKTIPGLFNVYAAASEEFRALMTVPFNLWLAETLLRDQTVGDALTTVNSEVQLLSLFWRHRIINTPSAREFTVLLTRVTEKMVAGRTLAVRVADVYPIGGKDAWDALLSSAVLDEDTHATRQRVSFAHNILFDYAVSVLLMEDDPERVAAFLADDPSRPLFLRPSVDYFFTRLWETFPQRFWLIFWHMLQASEQHVRIYARLVPTMVIAREARNVNQLSPLIDRLESGETAGPVAILNLLQTVRGVFNGQRDFLWASFGQRCCGHVDAQFVWELGALTFDILGRAAARDDSAVVALCGQTGRALLDWALRARSKQVSAFVDHVGAVWGVRLTARTYAAEPQASQALLRDVVQNIEQPGFPIEYFRCLTTDLKAIWNVDPAFAVAVYEAAFSHEETSEAKTSFGTPVMPLTSTRRQDFSMCQYHLTQDYPSFLSDKPVPAAIAAISALNGFVLERHVIRFLNPGFSVADLKQTFRFRDRDAVYLRDGSHSWDAKGLHRDQELSLAQNLLGRIEDKTATADNPEIGQFLDVFAEYAKVAFWWKRLLEIASRAPAAMATQVFEVASALPVLEHSETLHAVGMYIENAAPYLNVQQRSHLEQQILRLVRESPDEESLQRRKRWRDRLISRMPPNLLVSDEAKQLRTALESQGEIVSNEPLVRYSFSSGTYTQDKWLREKGVDPDREDNKSILQITTPLEQFETTWRNDRPTMEAVVVVIPILQAVLREIETSTTVDEEIGALGRTRLTSAARLVARADIPADSEAFSLCKAILLAGIEDARDTPSVQSEDRDEKYTFASWSPEPITNAAEGLPWLCRIVYDDEIVKAIEELSVYPEPSVRSLVVRELFRVIDTAPELFWRVVESRAAADRNVVVQESLAQTLGDVIARDEDRSVAALRTLTNRLIDRDEDSAALTAIVSIAMWLALHRQNSWAIALTDTLLAKPERYSHALHHAVFDTVHLVYPAKLDDGDNGVLNRAIEWLSRAATAVTQALRAMDEDRTGPYDETTGELFKRLYGVLDEIVMRLHFAFRPVEGNATDGQRVEFYWRVKPLLEQIANSSFRREGGPLFFATTTHHFVEFLLDAVDIDPTGALRLAATVTYASEGAGYHLDPMAAAETVRLAERIVADYRSELRRAEVLTDLVRLLDLFAKAGWPEALQLLWRLDEVFR